MVVLAAGRRLDYSVCATSHTCLSFERNLIKLMKIILVAKSKTQRSYCNTCFCKLRRNMKVPASRYWRHWNISPLMETPNICPMLEVRGHIPFIQHCVPYAKTIFLRTFLRGSNCFEQNGMKWLKLKGGLVLEWGMPFSLRSLLFGKCCNSKLD